MCLICYLMLLLLLLDNIELVFHWMLLNSLYLFVVGLVIHDQQIPISMSKDSIACRSSTSWGPQPWLQRRLWIPPKRCDPQGFWIPQLVQGKIYKLYRKLIGGWESMVSCKFPLNQTMRIINLLRMLRVQPYNYLKSLTNVLLFVPLAQGNHQENWRGGL